MNLESIINDNHSGSTLILKKICSYFSEQTECGWESNVNLLINDILLLRRSFVAFPVVIHFLNATNKFISGHQGYDLKGFVKEYEAIWKDKNSELIKKIIRSHDFRGKTLLFHSNSGMLHQLMAGLAEEANSITIIQTESRPAFEGRIQATLALDFQFKVRLITEAQLFDAVEACDLVVCGADWFSNSFFGNKTGTRVISELCKNLGKSFMVIADARKQLASNEIPPGIFGKKEEIWEHQNELLGIRNNYLEHVPIEKHIRIISG